MGYLKFFCLFSFILFSLGIHATGGGPVPQPYTEMTNENDPRSLFFDIEKARYRLLERFGENAEELEPNYFRKYTSTNIKNPLFFKNLDTKISEELLETKSGKPIKKMLDNKGWSSDYWPRCSGGVAVRWKVKESDDTPLNYIGYELVKEEDLTPDVIKVMSPAEKLDLYIGERLANGEISYRLTNFERLRTGVLKTVKGRSEYDPKEEIPLWEGLCHAWAPASLSFKAPTKIVVTGALGHEIPFYAGDLEALLILATDLELHSPQTFLGFRCEFGYEELNRELMNGKITEEEYNSKVSNLNCSETNAASFHIALTQGVNKNLQFVADVDPGPEVWNQPILGYKSKIKKTYERKLKYRKKASVMEKTFYHPDAVVKYLLQTTMFYLKERNPSEKRQKPLIENKVYYYWLEVDAESNIVQGYWEDILYQPDFFWTAPIPTQLNLVELSFTVPLPNGYHANRYFGTFDFSPLRRLYAKAVVDINMKRFRNVVRKLRIINRTAKFLFDNAKTKRLKRFYEGVPFQDIFLSDKDRRKKRLKRKILELAPSYKAKVHQRKVEFQKTLKEVRKRLGLVEQKETRVENVHEARTGFLTAPVETVETIEAVESAKAVETVEAAKAVETAEAVEAVETRMDRVDGPSSKPLTDIERELEQLRRKQRVREGLKIFEPKRD